MIKKYIKEWTDDDVAAFEEDQIDKIYGGGDPENQSQGGADTMLRLENNNSEMYRYYDLAKKLVEYLERKLDILTNTNEERISKIAELFAQLLTEYSIKIVKGAAILNGATLKFEQDLYGNSSLNIFVSGYDLFRDEQYEILVAKTSINENRLMATTKTGEEEVY